MLFECWLSDWIIRYIDGDPRSSSEEARGQRNRRGGHARAALVQTSGAGVLTASSSCRSPGQRSPASGWPTKLKLAIVVVDPDNQMQAETGELYHWQDDVEVE